MFNKSKKVFNTNKPFFYIFGIVALSAFITVFTDSDNSYTGNQLITAAHAEDTTINGGMVYNQFCAVCHKSGLNAAPKIGSKALWTKRVAQGRETVYKNAIDGIRGMPPRGGYSQLSDEEVKAATDYMISRSGGWGDD